MTTKKFPARFVLKGDVEAHWEKAVDFIPLDKELIEYKPDEDHEMPRFKIGDGKTRLNDLPFIVDANGGLVSRDWVIKYVSKCRPDWNQDDETAADYIKNRPFHSNYELKQARATVTTEYDQNLGTLAALGRLDSYITEMPTKINLNLDGVLYEDIDVKYDDSLNINYIGNPALLSGSGFEDTGENFCVAIRHSDFVFISKNDVQATTHNIIISYAVEVAPTKINEKYLPIDQTFTPNSMLPQSGRAVNEALAAAKTEITEEHLDYVNAISSSVSTFTLKFDEPSKIYLGQIYQGRLHGFEGLYKDFGQGLTKDDYYSFEPGTHTIKIYGLKKPNFYNIYWDSSSLLSHGGVSPSINHMNDAEYIRNFLYNIIEMDLGDGVTCDVGYLNDLQKLTLGYSTNVSGFNYLYVTNPTLDRISLTLVIKDPNSLNYEEGMFSTTNFGLAPIKKIIVPRESLDYCKTKFSDVVDKLYATAYVSDIDIAVANMNGDVTIATLETDDNTTIDLSNLEGDVLIDWHNNGILTTNKVNTFNAGTHKVLIYGITSTNFALSLGGCANSLTELVIANNIYEIREELGDFTKLKRVVLGKSLEQINTLAFVGCTNLTDVEFIDVNSVKCIGAYAFQGCTSLKEIKIGKNVTRICEGAFAGCTGVETIYFDAEDAVVDTDAFKFVGSSVTKGAKLVFGASVSKVPTSMFGVSENASDERANVTSIEFENASCCTEIGASAFYYLPIRSCQLPKTLKVIHNNAFDSCYNLGDLDIPYGVETIGDYAFRWSNRRTLTIPDSVTSIGEYILSLNGNVLELAIPFIGPNKESSGGYTIEYVVSKHGGSTELNIKTVTITGGSIASNAFDTFSTCNIEYLTFGPNVTNIAASILFNYKGTIEFTGKIPPVISGNLTYGAGYKYKLIVPSSAKDAYKEVLSDFDKKCLDAVAYLSDASKIYELTITDSKGNIVKAYRKTPDTISDMYNIFKDSISAFINGKPCLGVYLYGTRQYWVYYFDAFSSRTVVAVDFDLENATQEVTAV